MAIRKFTSKIKVCAAIKGYFRNILFMSEVKIKLCDHCKVKHPAKHYIQLEESFLIVCADCSRELNAIPGEQAVERDNKPEKNL
jgi:hypothetical protein